MAKIEIAEYNPAWPEIYEQEAALLKSTLGKNLVNIHHIGSTSIPGLCAKPKIDILAEVNSFADIDCLAMQKLGYEDRGIIFHTGRYFPKLVPKVHLHIFETGNPRIEQNLRFRNWLRSHPEDRDAYAQLKRELAQHHTDGMAFCYAKTNFIKSILTKALAQLEKIR